MDTRIVMLATLVLTACAKEPSTSVVIVPYGYVSAQAFQDALRRVDAICAEPPGFMRDRMLREFHHEHPTIDAQCRDRTHAVAL